jgi:hypothetical protein
VEQPRNFAKQPFRALGWRDALIGCLVAGFIADSSTGVRVPTAMTFKKT